MIVGIIRTALLVAFKIALSFLSSNLKAFGWFLLTSLPFILLKGLFNKYTIPGMFTSIVLYFCYAIWA